MSKIYYPEEIIDSKFENGKIFYHVKWKGYTDTTWEPEEHVEHRTDLIEQYQCMAAISQMEFKENGYVYCRVSSKEQSKYNEGHSSLEVQEEAIKKHCEEKGIKIMDIVREVYSARNMDKMKGLQHLCDVARPGQTIFVYDVSRFSRNIQHALNLLDDLTKKGVSIYSVSENIDYGSAAGRNHFRMQLCASTYFSDLLSQKVKASIAYRKNRGDYIGGVKYGYETKRVGNKTTKVRSMKEMRVIKMISEMWKKDASVKTIVTRMNDNNLKMRKKNITKSTVRTVIAHLMNGDLSC